MSSIDLFKKIAEDPNAFTVEGKEQPVSIKGLSVIEEQFGNFIDRLGDYCDQYRNQLHDDYYDDPDYSPQDDDWKEYPITNDEADSIEFEAFRSMFLDILKEAAILLNCSEDDIIEAYGFDYDLVQHNFYMMHDEQDFSDHDALKILEGIHKEVSATIRHLTTGADKEKSVISEYLRRVDDGTMYEDPSP